MWGWRSECRVVHRVGNGYAFVAGGAVDVVCNKGRQGHVVGHMWPQHRRDMHGSQQCVATIISDMADGKLPVAHSQL